MLYNPSLIATTDYVSAAATASTTGMLSIPANRYFSLSIMLSGSQNGVGTATPKVTLNNTTGGSPAAASSTVVAELSITGLVGVVANATGTVDVSGYSGSTGATLDFALGGATAACTINGFLQ